MRQASRAQGPRNASLTSQVAVLSALMVQPLDSPEASKGYVKPRQGHQGSREASKGHV